MAVQLDQNGKDDLKTQFATREGTYRLMTLSEYSRPNRVGYQTNQNNPQVRVSLVTLPSATTTTTGAITPPSLGTSSMYAAPAINPAAATNSILASTASNSTPVPSGGVAPIAAGSIGITNGQHQVDGQILSSPQPSQQPLGAGGGGDRICFNFGKELYVYAYRGCKKIPADLSKPIDKKLYKGTNPSCHDFNETVAVCDGAPLLVGFTTGQIQLVQPGKREPGRLYNEERFIDKTKVTCLKWLPKSPNLFLASHASGHLYLYNEELPCTPSAPNYQPFKSGDGYTILTCKAKSTRNPLYKWTFGNDPNGCINEFAFSPCGLMLAIVSQDGFLRVFNYDKMELLGVARSYFGGFLCVCWSPDGKYIVVGGEDDLVTVWSLHERRVVARGQGHRSWVSVVAFDPFTSYSQWDGPDFSDDENPMNDGVGSYRCYQPPNGHSDDVEAADDRPRSGARPSSFRDSTIMPERLGTSYRLGSVSQDTQLCLWDITEDVLRQSHEIRQRLSSHDPQNSNGEVGMMKANYSASGDGATTNAAAKVINPVTLTTKDSIDSSTHSKGSNSSGASKFGTANCSGSGGESGCSSFNEKSNSAGGITSNKPSSSVSVGGGGGSSGITANIASKATIKIGGGDVGDKGTNTASDPNKSSSSSSGTSKSANESSNSSSSSSGLTAFNSITQRLSNFSFGNDKKSTDGSNHNATSHKKAFTFSKSTGNHTGFLHNNIHATIGGVSGDQATATMSTSLKHSKATTSSSSIVPSYDPMQLIGTSVCPRFDECPLLEPLVCKKIAHERLTALIFREDCFLTACQDGFIYTWARPGFSNIPQHLSSSPGAPPGGTVV